MLGSRIFTSNGGGLSVFIPNPDCFTIWDQDLKLSPALSITLIIICGASHAEEIVITKALVIGPVTRGGRTLIHRDPVEAQIVTGSWHSPNSGEAVGGA